MWLIKEKIFVQCGKCRACKKSRSREWSERLMHERAMHDNAFFITLTYNEKYIPEDGSLRKEDLQKYFKRLRKRTERKMKYFACGEYGTKEWRPHYHIIMYGLSFEELGVYKNCKDSNYYTYDWSKYIKNEEYEPFGFVNIQDCNIKSCQYVTGYIVKDEKVKGEYARKYFQGMQPKFQLQSQGLGKEFYKKNIDHLINKESVVIDEARRKIPRYYYKKLKESDPEKAQELAERRKKYATIENENIEKDLNEEGIKGEDIRKYLDERKIQCEKNMKAYNENRRRIL